MGNSITFDKLELAQLATKGDLLNLEKSLKDEINIVKSDITLLKYMNGIIIGILIALSMKFIFN